MLIELATLEGGKVFRDKAVDVLNEFVVLAKKDVELGRRDRAQTFVEEVQEAIVHGTLGRVMDPEDKRFVIDTFKEKVGEIGLRIEIVMAQVVGPEGNPFGYLSDHQPPRFDVHERPFHDGGRVLPHRPDKDW